MKTSPLFQIGYYLDTYPQRTENFILREISGVVEYWPNLRVYCQHQASSNWEAVETALQPPKIQIRPVNRPIHSALVTHIKWLLKRPKAYLNLIHYSFRLHEWAIPRAMWRFDRAVQLAERARQDDITHLHAHFANEISTICHLAARILGITYSISAHAHDIWAQRPLAPVMGDALCCICCTAEGRDHLKRIFPWAQVTLVYHCLTGKGDHKAGGARQKALPPNLLAPLKIFSAGRLIPKKGFDILIEACALLIRQGIDVRCEIFGDGPEKEPLQRRVEHLGLENRITLHPFIPHRELLKHLATAHLCVLACRIDPQTGDRDGIPNILLEAMAGGVIVVTTELPALKEIFVDGENGFLAPAGSPAGLSSAIQKALAAQSAWPRIRSQARKTLAMTFSAKKNIVRLKEIIEGSFRQAHPTGPKPQKQEER